MARTKHEFTVNLPDFWGRVDAWAQDHAAYLLSEQEDDLEKAYERLYRTRPGVTMVPVHFRVLLVGERARVEAWLGPGENALEGRSVLGGQRSAAEFGTAMFQSLLRTLGVESS